MGETDFPVGLGVIVGSAIIGALIAAGLIIGLIVSGSLAA